MGSGRKVGLCAALVTLSLVAGLVLYLPSTDVPPNPDGDGLEDIYNLWVRTYPHQVLDSYVSVVECQQGGFALACVSDDMRAKVIRIDDEGNDTWETYLTEGGYIELRDLYECQNGDLVMTGVRLLGENWTWEDRSLWILRMSQNGTVLWERMHTGLDTGACVVECQNGDLAVAASFSHLVRLDSEGNVLWNRTYGDGDVSWISSLVQCDDGGFALTGALDVNPNPGSYSYMAWLVRTDALGTELWRKTYGNSSDNYLWSIANCSDGGFALAGEKGFGGYDQREFWIVRTSASGSVVWDRTYCKGHACAVVETPDGGLAAAGTLANDSTYVNREAFFVRTDALGNPLWTSIGSGPEEDRAYSMSACASGNFVVTGTTRQDNLCLSFLWRLADSDVPVSGTVTIEIPTPPPTKPGLTCALGTPLGPNDIFVMSTRRLHSSA